MSFVCVICCDLLKISEEASPQHRHHLHHSSSSANNDNCTTSPFNSTSCNNVLSATSTSSSSARRKGKNNSIVATKCGHLFHYPCLSVWLSQSMNLTSDSIMRCPSCKQLIYIYELIQLFPVESNCVNGDGFNALEPICSQTFQRKMKCAMGQLENLIRDLGSTSIVVTSEMSMTTASPKKGNETPTRLRRIRDSPKKSQVAEITTGMESLLGSIKQLNTLMEQHSEWGSVLEKQSKEISELKMRNEELIQQNEKLKETPSFVNGDELMSSGPKDESTSTQSGQMLENVQTTDEKKEITETNAAQVSLDLTKGPKSLDPATHLTDNNNVHSKIPNSINGQNRRKSVTFIDPFDEFEEKCVLSNTNIPHETRDLRVGDKVIWYFEGNPEVGTVKWKGFVGSQINVGVEFERQLGLPIKDLSADALQCIFKSKPGHGRLIPVHEIRSYDKSLFRDTSSSITNNHSKSSECVHCDSKSYGSGGSGTKRFQICTHQ